MSLIDELEMAVKAGTKGTWKALGCDIRVFYQHFDHRMGYASTIENADLICLAVNHLPALLAVAKAAHALVNGPYSGSTMTLHDQQIHRNEVLRQALARLDGDKP